MKRLAAALALAVALTAFASPARPGGMSDYLENKVADYMFRSQAWTQPTTLAIALIRATRGYWAASTVYTVGDTLIPIAPNGRLYKATAVAGTGTSGAAEPTWPTTAGGTVVDNAGANQITWTEQTTALEAGTFTEVANAGAYARVTLSAAFSNWSGTGGETTNVGSAGANGTVKNNSSVAYSAPTANWGVIFGYAIIDSATYGAGNMLFYAALTTPKTINAGDAAPSFAVNALTVQIDN